MWPIYVKNVKSSFNKKRPIEYTVEINIYYQEHRKRTEINIIEGYDELVEKILRRIEENNLYMKLEKYKWKVREVDLLELVIGLEEIKIEEEKAVLN